MPVIPPRRISGRYRGGDEHTEVELRVDVDGPRPTRRVSADYYRNGRSCGSMRVDAPKIVVGTDSVTILGAGVFSDSAQRPTVTVSIPRLTSGGPAAPATLSHRTADAVPGGTYVCSFEGEDFRRVEFEEAYQRGVTPSPGYDTGTLPSTGPRRSLSPTSAFAEAGIELATSGSPAEVDPVLAGPDATWNDAELHAAMERYFTRLGDGPRWAVWQLLATRHDREGLYGLMFDRGGSERHGCAVFQRALAGSPQQRARRELFSSVHELGHAFNLPHAWQATRTSPRLPSRPAAATWMNYPGLFPGGEDAYWRKFAFQFDDTELVHLRHGFRQNVIMGGAPFVGDAALQEVAAQLGRGHRRPALALSLEAPATIASGLPVTCGLVLSLRTAADQVVPGALGPRAGTVDISVRPPEGKDFVFEPLLRHCHGDESTTLTVRAARLRDYAFMHYGRQGFAFATAGVYRVRARYTSVDGSIVFSNVTTIRVLAPATRADRAVTELVAGDEQVGTLLSLMGSRDPDLRAGDETLQAVIDRFPRHPFADIARVVRGVALGRDYKILDSDGAVALQASDPRLARALLERVIDLSSMKVRPGVNPAVVGFINSRWDELEYTATVLGMRPVQAAGGPTPFTVGTLFVPGDDSGGRGKTGGNGGGNRGGNGGGNRGANSGTHGLAKPGTAPPTKPTAYREGDAGPSDVTSPPTDPPTAAA